MFFFQMLLRFCPKRLNLDFISTIRKRYNTDFDRDQKKKKKNTTPSLYIFKIKYFQLPLVIGQLDNDML